MRLLCLAGLPRLQSFASVLLCQGSCLADRSHTPSTYPLGTRLTKQPRSLDIANKVFWAFLSCEDCPNTSNARTPFPWVAGLQSLVAQSSIFLCVSPERNVVPWSWRQYPFPD